MRGREEQMMAIKTRIFELHSQRYLRIARELSAVCAVLIVALGTILHDRMGSGVLMVQERYGAILLTDSVSAYFIVALLAFVLGCAFTIVCVCISRKSKNSRSLEEMRK